MQLCIFSVARLQIVMIKAILKYVMNKVINNNTEIRLENKDGDGKTNKKKETGTHEDVSLIKINSTFV